MVVGTEGARQKAGAWMQTGLLIGQLEAGEPGALGMNYPPKPVAVVAALEFVVVLRVGDRAGKPVVPVEEQR